MAKAWWRDSDYELFARLTKERDEARAEVERWRTSYDAASAHAVDVRAMLDQVRKELYEARAEIAILTTALDERDLEAERGLEQYDRLMHQVEALTDERDELLVRVANQDAELRATREAYTEARAEVERLKLSARLWADDIDAVSNAYRRGAEAMRETCANAMHPIMRSMISRTEAAQTIRALPIPEEP